MPKNLKIFLCFHALFLGIFLPCKASHSQALDFSAVLSMFHQMTDLQQAEAAENLKGKFVEGEGELKDIGECGKSSATQKWRKQGCFELRVNSSAPRSEFGYPDDIILYVSKKEKNKLISLNKGNIIRFNQCTVISIQKLGSFDKWWRIKCDLPHLTEQLN